jgi:hypothetical protein
MIRDYEGWATPRLDQYEAERLDAVCEAIGVRERRP